MTLAERLDTTPQAARDELEALAKKRDKDKSVLKARLTTDLKAVDTAYRTKATKLRALLRALESEETQLERPTGCLNPMARTATDAQPQHR